MARARLDDAALLDHAVDVFRAYGFEGTSVNQMAAATGLEKASLYYRYPGSKDEIAMAAAAHVSGWFEQNILSRWGRTAVHDGAFGRWRESCASFMETARSLVCSIPSRCVAAHLSCTPRCVLHLPTG